MVRLHFQGSLGLLDGSHTIIPDMTVHHVGGHTLGIQVAEVGAAKGAAVVASDAAKLYRNVTENNAQPRSHDVSDLLAGFQRIRQLAAREDLILPGHDPSVR